MKFLRVSFLALALMVPALAAPAQADPVTITAGIAAAASFFATPVIGSLTIGSLLTTAALSGASFLINKALAPKVRGFGGIDEGQKATVQQAVPSQRLIYGRALVGGPLFFYECKPPFLYIGVVLASHEIEAVEEIRINGNKVTFDGTGAASSTNFVNGSTSLVYASIRTGTATQAMDPILEADFPEIAADTAWRQRGHATVVLKCDYATDAATHERYWGSASPRFEFLVKGMKVFNPCDPTQSSSDASTWQWSDTASLCLAHFLTYGKAGKRPWASIDIPALCTAATADAESVSLADGTVEKRYTINGVVDLTADIGEGIQNMLTAHLGRLIWSDGKYSILSGVPRDPVWTLNDNSARGDMDAQSSRARRDLVNVVRTVFVAPDREYQTANGPVLRNETYITADGEEHEITITLPFTSSHTRAQRIAKATMERARLGRSISRREDIAALRLNAADIVNIEVNFLPVLSGMFEINSAKLDHERFEIEIEAEEYSPAIYDWTVADEQEFTIEPAELAGVN